MTDRELLEHIQDNSEHKVCQARVAAGGTLTCCLCDPHLGCTLPFPADQSPGQKTQ